MLNASDKFIKAMRSPIKQLFIKLELYQADGTTFIKEITKSVTSDDIGNIAISTDNPIRRSFTFSLYNKDNEFDWGSDNVIWIDKRVKLFIGLKLSDGTIEYVQQGVFILTELQDSSTLDGKKSNIVGKDKAYLISDRRGNFINHTTIATGTSVSAAIKTIAQGVGENMFNFDVVTETTPYELTYEAGSSRWEAISQLAKFAKCDIYYDVNGYLRLRKIDLNEFNSIAPVWKFSVNDPSEKFYAGNIRKLDDTICNRIVVLGGSGQTATQRYEIIVTNTDPKWANSPFARERIGEILYQHNSGNPDPLLGGNSVEPAKWRAKFELMNRLSYTERVSLSSAPMYLFDANDVIEIEDNPTQGKYLVTSFNLPINPQLMQVECLKYVQVINDWNSF